MYVVAVIGHLLCYAKWAFLISLTLSEKTIVLKFYNSNLLIFLPFDCKLGWCIIFGQNTYYQRSPKLAEA